MDAPLAHACAAPQRAFLPFVKNTARHRAYVELAIAQYVLANRGARCWVAHVAPAGVRCVPALGDLLRQILARLEALLSDVPRLARAGAEGDTVPDE